MQVFHFVIG